MVMYKLLFTFFIVLVTNIVKSSKTERFPYMILKGKVTAYIATEDMTIYMWSGKTRCVFNKRKRKIQYNLVLMESILGWFY